jgi:hypothetical protein
MVVLARTLGLILASIHAHQDGFAQTFQIKGTVNNELTSGPVPEANIRVYGTNQGTPTDKAGNFTLPLVKLPVTIVISCVGYDRAVYDILEKPTSPVRILLRPVTYVLKEVEISPVSYSSVYEDKTYSVLDYELMDDHVALLVFRNALQRTGMVLLSRDGDTLAVSDLPELPPEMLRRDFLSNVHYYSRYGSAYQCYYNPENQSLDFLPPIATDSLEKYVMPYLFRISERLYVQEKVLHGFGTAIAYYSKDGGKQYIKNCMNEKKISEYHDDMAFYLRWNGAIGSYTFPEDDIESEERFNFSIPQGEGGAYGKNEARAHQFEFYNMTYPLFKLNEDTMAFFNFGSDLLELLYPDGKVIATAPISFHKGSTGVNPLANNDRVENDGWRWGTKIMTDEASHDLYTMFLRSGMVMIRKIDIKTGNLGVTTIIPFPFPEKIKLYKGEAFFLCKESGNNENWKLLKCSIR